MLRQTLWDRWQSTPHLKTHMARLFQRLLDAIPGGLVWLALLFTIVGARFFPETLFSLAAALGLYSALRFCWAAIAEIVGVRRVQRWERLDWQQLHANHAAPDKLAWDDVQHVVIIPNYNEPFALLCRTLEHLAEQQDARMRLTVVLAMEEAEHDSAEKARRLQQRYESCFASIYYTIHPKGLPGEIRCKSSNQTWAARWIKHRLVDEQGSSLDRIVITSMDADTRWHPRYFAALSYLFATNPERHKRFWQAPIRHHGNIWQISPPMRLMNAYSSALELAYLSAPGWLPMPMSSYSLSLRLLDSIGYWDTDAIADEWRAFIKAYFKRRGSVQIERVFLPFVVDAPTGKTLWQSIRNRYLQTVRHYWGSKEIGYTIASMAREGSIPPVGALRLLFRVAHDTVLASTGWIIITFGSNLPYMLNPYFVWEMRFEDWSDPALIILQVAFFIVAVLSVVCWYQDVRVRPPRTEPLKPYERLMTLLSFPLLPVLTLLFVVLPAIHAQTRLMLGIPLQFRVTEKMI